ncbi:hypothetical protein F5879DRAFT_1024167 [Lentinula edodes]|nr:hypothetical protein F5879DRAFT_1024167 [Lentinula edodes]
MENHETLLFDCLTRSIKERGEKGLHVEEGYTEEHKEDIITFLYKSQSSFRNTLKRLAEPMVISHYGLPLPKDQEPNTGFNAAQFNELTVAYVDKLLQKSFFLQDGRDINYGGELGKRKDTSSSKLFTASDFWPKLEVWYMGFGIAGYGIAGSVGQPDSRIWDGRIRDGGISGMAGLAGQRDSGISRKTEQ